IPQSVPLHHGNWHPAGERYSDQVLLLGIVNRILLHPVLAQPDGLAALSMTNQYIVDFCCVHGNKSGTTIVMEGEDIETVAAPVVVDSIEPGHVGGGRAAENNCSSGIGSMDGFIAWD